MQITNIAMPISTCQNKILNGNGIIKPKLILITNKIPKIPDAKKVISKKTFQILLCVKLLIDFLFDKNSVIKYSKLNTIKIGKR